MKKLIAWVLGVGVVGSVVAQPSVGVSIGINQPGVYGRINIGDVPRPALILPQPVIISQPRYEVHRSPIYLYVPPAHQQNWRQYCGRYEACGQPVYFVKEQWVRERYEHEHPGWNRGRHRGWDKHDKHDKHEKQDKHDKHGDKGKGHGRGPDH